MDNFLEGIKIKKQKTKNELFLVEINIYFNLFFKKVALFQTI